MNTELQAAVAEVKRRHGRTSMPAGEIVPALAVPVSYLIPVLRTDRTGGAR